MQRLGLDVFGSKQQPCFGRRLHHLQRTETVTLDFERDVLCMHEIQPGLEWVRVADCLLGVLLPSNVVSRKGYGKVRG